MGEQYIKEYSVCCPRTLQKGKHQVEYAKATCTRVPDTLLHFHCTINGKCKDCERDYQEQKNCGMNMERNGQTDVYPRGLQISIQYLYRSFFRFTGPFRKPYGKGRYPGYKTVGLLCGQSESKENTKPQKQTSFNRSIHLLQDMAVLQKAVYKSMKEIDGHGTDSQYRVKMLFPGN